MRGAVGGGFALVDFAFAGEAGLDGVAGADGVDEAQGVEAVVGEHGAGRRGDEQAGGGGEQEVAVGDAFAELGVFGGDFVEVHVEVVAGEAAEVDDVGFGDGAAVGEQGFADGEVVEVAAEGVHFGFEHVGAAHVFAGDGGQHGRRALDGGALQVVVDGADAAEFFAAAGAAGAAVFEHGQGRAVAGGLFRGFGVEHLQAAVAGGQGRDGAGGVFEVFGGEGGDQAAFAFGGEFDRFVQVAVAHQGADRAEGFDVVGAAVGVGVVAAQQARGEEGAVFGAFADRGRAAVGTKEALAGVEQVVDGGGDVFFLRDGGQRAHPHAFFVGVAEGDFFQTLDQAFGEGIEVLLRDHDAADGGAFLAGFDGHLADDFLGEQVQFFVVGGDVRGEDGAVQRIRFGVEGDGAVDDVGVRAQFAGGVRGAGEGDHVLFVELVEQIPGAADHQLQGAFGQRAGVLHEAHAGRGDIAGGGGRFDDAGHAGEEVGGEFFQHAPDREVEGVDVHGDAAARHQDVGAGEVVVLSEGDHRAFVDHVAGGQLFAAHAGVGEQGAEAAVDVEGVVAFGGAGVARQLIEFFFVFLQVKRHGLEAGGAFLEVELEQCFDAGGAAVVHGGGEVRGVVVGVRDDLAVDGAGQRLAGLAAEPLAGEVALEDGHGVAPC